MKFSDVVGQHSIIKSLIYSKNEGRIPHALMLTGPEGCGKLALAISFAQYINCELPSESDSCGVCSSCIKYQKLIHPDLHFVFPLMKKAGENTLICNDFIKEWREMVLNSPYFTDLQWYSHIKREEKQGVIYAEESVEIVKKLNLKTFEAEYKCMIIWLPEKMNITAANKLLKILEEPPSKTVFILVAEQTESMLTTILSRCQILKVSPIKDSDLLVALKNKNNNNEHDINNAVILAEGNFIKAISILESNEEDKVFLDYFIKLMRLTFVFNVIELIKLSNEVSTFSKEKQKDFLIFILKQIRDNFNISSESQSTVRQSPEENEFSQKFHKYINNRNVNVFYSEIELAIAHLERNGNAKIIFLDLFLAISAVIKK